MTILVCVLMTLALVTYIFYPEKQVAAQSEKTRIEFLEERKAALYDNLRDLNFEYKAGKYRDDEYAAERSALEDEAAGVLSEIDLLAAPTRRA